MTLFSQATGRQVVSTSTAETVGHIGEFVVDPAKHEVVALQLKKSGHGDTLLWSNITAFGADAVTVSGTDQLGEASTEIAALAHKDKKMVGRRVLSTTGDELGSVKDVEFDPETGAVTSIVLGSGTVAGVRLIGIGSWAVVVQSE